MDIIEAVIAHLESVLPCPVWDAYVPDQMEPDYPYVLVADTQPTSQIERLTVDDGMVFSRRIVVYFAGNSPVSVRAIAQKSRAALIGWTPGMVDGIAWDRVAPVRNMGLPIVVDKDMPPVDGNPILWGADYYDLVGN
ncbi:MAG: hypothetical protein FWG25_11255 [Promicromonosporaceae bacterium]|nr:hypothetical protein [Promicromonosporaceae bacterium]